MDLNFRDERFDLCERDLEVPFLTENHNCKWGHAE